MTMARGARITGEQRQALAVELRGRYDAGESVRSLADSCGRSYGFVQTLLKEAGTGLRSRGGAMPRTTAEKVPTRVTTQSGVSAEGEAEVPRRASTRPPAGSAAGATRRRTGTAAASSRSRTTSTATPPAEVVAGATVLEGARSVLAAARGTGVTGIAGANDDARTGRGATSAAGGAREDGKATPTTARLLTEESTSAKGKTEKGGSKNATTKDAKVKSAKVKSAKTEGAKGKDAKGKDAKVKDAKVKDAKVKDAKDGKSKSSKVKDKATSGKGSAKGKSAGKKG